jgi:hypothetical protein
VAEFPDSFEQAFKRWCSYARRYADTRRFRTWRTDFRRKQDAEDLLVLASLDCDAFFRRHRPNDGGDGELIMSPPPLALTDGRVLPERELVDA